VQLLTVVCVCTWSLQQPRHTNSSDTAISGSYWSIIAYYYYYYYDPGTPFPGNEKILLCSTKVQNQAGMNLTPPPSQNSHAARWHCTAESKQRVAEIKS